VYVDNDENVFSKKSSKMNQFMDQKGISSIKKGSKIEVKNEKIQQKVVKNLGDFYVYTDDDQGTYKEPVFADHNDKNCVEKNEIQVYIDKNDENNGNGLKIPDVYVDNDENDDNRFKIPDVYVDNDENDGKGFKIPDVYVDDDENVFSKKSSKVNQFMGQKGSSIIKNGSKLELKYDKNSKQPIKIPKYQVYEDESYETNNTEKQVDKTKENSINPSNEGKSPIKKIPNVSLLYVYFVV